ncbi:hypothetical protein LZ554_004288 [Drepanopeziza brunnea f. sp. 'monogermtubi']|nr:hypothetical protein LZ554_004288 [Drepanopeziza brunnea f. sp. 'monogermtubi']
METVSMVSELGGDSHQRPKLDVPAWKKRTVAQLLGSPSLGMADKKAFSHSHSRNRQLYTQQAHEDSIDLDLGAKMPNRASASGKCKLMDRLLSILHLGKKNKKESKERRVEFEDAPEPSRHKAEKEDERSEERKRGLDHQRQKEKRKQHSMDSRAMDKNLRVEYTAQNCTDSSKHRVRREAPKIEDTEDRYTGADREEYVPRRRVRREKAKPQRRDTDIKEKRRELPPVIHQARPKPQGRDTDIEEKRRDVPPVIRQARPKSEARDTDIEEKRREIPPAIRQTETSKTRSRPSTAGNARLTSKNLRQYDDGDNQQDGSKTTESLWGSRQSAINFGSIINRHDSPDISNPPTRPPARSQHVQSTPIGPPHRLSLPTDSQARSRYQISSETHPSEMTGTSTGISRRHATRPASIPTADHPSPRQASARAPEFTSIWERRRAKRESIARTVESYSSG